MPDSFVGDFSKVKERSFNTKRMPEGEYRAKIVKIGDHDSNSGKPNWLYTVKLVDHPTAVYPYYVGLSQEQLWKIRNLYEACGVHIPKKKARLRRDQLLNKTLGVVLEDDEYEGKPKSVIADVIPFDEVSATPDNAEEEDEEVEDKETEEEEEEAEEEGEEEEEEEPPAKPKKKAAAKATKAKAKPKPKAAADDDELEEIEIEDL